MKIALFDDQRLGIVDTEAGLIADVTRVAEWNPEKPHESLVHLMEHFDELRPDLERAARHELKRPISEVRLRPPVPAPTKIVAAPVNYKLHQEEMNQQFQNAEFTVEKLGFFLKAPSSIIGPDDTVLLPPYDRRFDHEAELAYVVGRRAKDVPRSEAYRYIFGYFALMDITMRGKEDRPMRKSFDTFTPIGPWIVTSDEVGDPNALSLKLWVNDDLRQSANTKDLIYDCYRFFEAVSKVMTLEPGDIVTTGTPEGVGPIQTGDRVCIEIERIGRFCVNVEAKMGIESKG